MHFRHDIGAKGISFDAASDRFPSRHSPKPLTYASAGVSISAGNELVNHIKPYVASTAQPGADGSLGGFGDLLDPKALGYKDSPIIV